MCLKEKLLCMECEELYWLTQSYAEKAPDGDKTTFRTI